MRNIQCAKAYLTLAIIGFSSLSASAQSNSDGNVFPLAIAIIIGALIMAVVVLFADSFLQLEAKRRGVNPKSISGNSGLRKWFLPKPPAFVEDEPIHFLKDGFDIKLEGSADKELLNTKATRFAVQPPNFNGLSPIPKMMVEVGDEVLAGDVLYFDKKNPDVKHVAPVSGEIVAINRGAKRSIAEVVILADKEIRFKILPGIDLEQSSREEIVTYLQDIGFWPFIQERPFNVIASTESIPENIFISTFDTAPSAPDLNFVIEGRESVFQAGLNALAKLTSGDIHLGLNAKANTAPSSAFMDAEGVVKHWFHGPHPAGNVGVQIHHISDIGKGQKVWTLSVEHVLLLGEILMNNKFDTSRRVALTGIENAGYVETYLGANVGELLKNTNVEHHRIVSGNLLSGKEKTPDGFLNAFDRQLSIVEEGDHYEMFGWLVPSKARPSVSRTYPNFLFPDLKYKPDTNTHGEARAFVVTDQYEKLLPMDIFPQHLMKAIMAEDFERMEGLGIYELVEEDVALCEFACTSKTPLQKILREGLTLMQEQG